MKKVIKNRIFLVIICGIIFTSIGVFAANTYKASDILYTSSDGISMNVNDALNDLKNLCSNQQLYNLYLASGYKDLYELNGAKTITFTKTQTNNSVSIYGSNTKVSDFSGMTLLKKVEVNVTGTFTIDISQYKYLGLYVLSPLTDVTIN